MGTQQDSGWHVMPRTAAGQWALALFAGFLLAVVVTVSAHLRVTVGPFNLVGGFNFLAAIAGGALALYAMLVRAERSFVLLVPVMLALFVFVFEAAELLLPPY